MKRASYRHAVEWIAYNDDDACMEEEIVREQVTVLLVADLFGVDSERVARDVMRKRKAYNL